MELLLLALGVYALAKKRNGGGQGPLPKPPLPDITPGDHRGGGTNVITGGGNTGGGGSKPGGGQRKIML